MSSSSSLTRGSAVPSRTFTLEELEELDVSWENQIKREIYSGRWNVHSNVVFRADDDKLYLIQVSEGLTEYHETYGPEKYPEMNWQTHEIELPEVEIYEVMLPVKKWRTV